MTISLVSGRRADPRPTPGVRHPRKAPCEKGKPARVSRRRRRSVLRPKRARPRSRAPGPRQASQRARRPRRVTGSSNSWEISTAREATRIGVVKRIGEQARAMSVAWGHVHTTRTHSRSPGGRYARSSVRRTHSPNNTRQDAPAVGDVGPRVHRSRGSAEIANPRPSHRAVGEGGGGGTNRQHLPAPAHQRHNATRATSSVAVPQRAEARVRYTRDPVCRRLPADLPARMEPRASSVAPTTAPTHSHQRMRVR